MKDLLVAAGMLAASMIWLALVLSTLLLPVFIIWYLVTH